MTEILKERQAADFLGISVFKLRKHRENKQLPRFIRMGRAIRYTVKDLMDYINSVTVAPENEVSA